MGKRDRRRKSFKLGSFGKRIVLSPVRRAAAQSGIGRSPHKSEIDQSKY